MKPVLLLLIKFSLLCIYCIVAYNTDKIDIIQGIIIFSLINLCIFNKESPKNSWKRNIAFYIALFTCISGLLLIILGMFIAHKNTLIIIGAIIFAPVFTGLAVTETMVSFKYYKNLIITRQEHSDSNY